jgi:energy-coupling factor transport system permease protein
MFFLYLFTTPDRSLVTMWRIAVTWEGIVAGGTQIYRLCLLVVISALLTLTISPAQLAHGLGAVLGPLARVGLPVLELAMVPAIALRFVPTLFNEIDKIVKAERARGADLRSRSPWQRVRSWPPRSCPSSRPPFDGPMIWPRRWKQETFEALGTTRLYRLRFTRQDLVASLVVLMVSLVAIALARLA